MTDLPLPDSADSPDRLARLYGPLVFRAAYRVLGDAALAEDVQQDVFLRLLQTPPANVASWPAYLSASAARAAIDVLRRRRRWWRLLPMWAAHEPVAAPSAEQVGIEREQAQRLRTALAGLPRREAECFGLRYLENMAIGAIAQTLAISENNVNVILHRARRRLEARLVDTTAEATP